jgi:hypothetical protein
MGQGEVTTYGVPHLLGVDDDAVQVEDDRLDAHGPVD